MNFLVVYGTTEGQTRKISKFTAAWLEDAGHNVTVLDSHRRMQDLDISDYDAVILAGSVHQNKHQNSICNFAVAHKVQLNDKPTLLMSVSLSVAFDDGQKKAQDYVDDFVDYTGFSPDKSLLVAGALRYDEYDFFMEQIVEYVVLKDHEEVSGDKEFTNWEALGIDLDTFIKTVAKDA